MTTYSSIRAQYLKHTGAKFLIFVLVFVSRDFDVGSSRSRLPVPYGANLFSVGFCLLRRFFQCWSYCLLGKLKAFKNVSSVFQSCLLFVGPAQVGANAEKVPAS